MPYIEKEPIFKINLYWIWAYIEKKFILRRSLYYICNIENRPILKRSFYEGWSFFKIGLFSYGAYIGYGAYIERNPII